MSRLTFVEWIQSLYTERFTGKIELDFLNGIPRSWSKQAPRVPFQLPRVDKHERSRDALTV